MTHESDVSLLDFIRHFMVSMVKTAVFPEKVATLKTTVVAGRQRL